MKLGFYSVILGIFLVIIFLIQLSVPGFTELFLLNQQAFYQYWRFVTAIFLHGSTAHLLYNLFALVFFGFILENIIGSKKFLTIFFIAGILANIVSVNFYTASLGASGAIMGVIGALAAIKPFMMVWAFGLILPMALAAGLWIVGDILGIFVPDGVGNIAHLAGIAIGIIIGVSFRVKRRKKSRKKSSVQYFDNYLRL
jgi:membrane associated rhomboid family serine protease